VTREAEFAGKVAVVTGGASGLGAAACEALAAGGADVLVADVDLERAVKVADGCGARAARVDVTRDGDVAALFGGLDRLDVLVLSAAVEVRRPLGETTDDDWRRVIDVNLKGPFLCMRHGLPVMVRTGGGSVVALGSVLGAIGAPQYAAYCASKGALVNLCKQAAIEHAPDGIRVNVVSPSACEAGLFMEVASQAPDPDAVKAMVARGTPMGRLGTIDDVTSTILFLAGRGSAYISGTVIPLDGGMAARRM
jgi:NAD(P)-dependent dehydrogenase (short-subunit alcohol dehydrogenase family)